MRSEISSIDELTLQNCSEGVLFYSSSVDSLKNSLFENCGSDQTIEGGAVYLEKSNMTMVNSTLNLNKAQKGAAVSIN